MARPTDRTRGKKDAEATYPHRIDVPVPGGGLGKRLPAMLDWCRENVAAGLWAEHGHSERREGVAPLYYSRWYFMTEADAAAFRWRWLREEALTGMSDREVFSAAIRMIQRYGDDTESETEARVAQCVGAGDEAGAEEWRRIRRTVERSDGQAEGIAVTKRRDKG